MKAFFAILFLFAALFLSLPCAAVWYGSPVPVLQEGELAVGVVVSDFNRKIRGSAGGKGGSDSSRETIFGDYALSPVSAARLELSTVDLGNFRGTEFALGYRRRVGESRTIGPDDLPVYKGVFGSVRTASLSRDGENADFIQIDLGAGLVVLFSEEVSVYGGGVLSLLDGTAAGRDFEGDSTIGLFGGGEFALDKEMRLGGELHLLMESGFALFFRYLF